MITKRRKMASEKFAIDLGRQDDLGRTYDADSHLLEGNDFTVPT